VATRKEGVAAANDASPRGILAWRVREDERRAGKPAGTIEKKESPLAGSAWRGGKSE
jgi:hypothetical protein